MPWENVFGVTSDSAGREESIWVPREDIKVVVGLLQSCELIVLGIRTSKFLEWKCIPILLSYYWDNLEGNVISAERHRVEEYKKCIRFMGTRDDIFKKSDGRCKVAE